MWPWDHLAVGYVVYSLVRRLARRPPGDALTVGFVIVGSQLPDLIDKPLGWVLGVLPSGVSLAHSLFFAVPVCLAVGLWRTHAGRPDDGLAFGLAYLAHLPADAFYPLLLGSEAKTWLFLWPVTPGEHTSPTDVTLYLADLVGAFLEVLSGPAGAYIIGLEVGTVTLAFVLWAADGLPGVELVRA